MYTSRTLEGRNRQASFLSAQITFLLAAVAILSLLTTFSSSMCYAQELPPLPGERPGLPRVKPGMPQPGVLPNVPKTGEQLVKVRSSADVERVKPGEKFHLAFIFDIEPHWHIYWQNSGASGGPTQIKVTGPEGFAIGKTLFTRPIAIKGEEGVTYAYENQTVLFVEVTAPLETMSNLAMFSASINWLVCKDVCLMGRTQQTVSVPIQSGNLPSVPGFGHEVDPLVKQYRDHLPKPLESLNKAVANFESNQLLIKLPAHSHTKAEFFPLEMPGVTYGEATVKAEGEFLHITVPVTVNPNDALGEPLAIRGLVGLGDAQTDPGYTVEIALPAT